ncbi:MAG: glycosyltransferase family 2 protein [Terriglobales bacterium]
MRSLVSVIIPAYNATKFLADSIRSVLAQTYRNLEIIVVDDGSTDTTAQVTRSFGDEVRYIHKPNGGQASALNLGIRHAHGEYIAFQDADDVWLPDKLERQCQHLDANPQFGMVCTDLSEVDEELRVIQTSKCAEAGLIPKEGWMFDQELLVGFIFPSAILVRRALLIGLDVFDENLRYQTDKEFFLRFLYRYQSGFINIPLVLRRRHDSNLTNNYNEGSLPEKIRILEQARQQFEMSLPLRCRLRLQLARDQAQWGRHNLSQGRLQQARRSCVKSLGQYPLSGAWIYLAVSGLGIRQIRWFKRIKYALTRSKH